MHGHREVELDGGNHAVGAANERLAASDDLRSRHEREIASVGHAATTHIQLPTKVRPRVSSAG
jgi:hypothetical protein